VISDYRGGATPSVLETDLCIIGAGAAGITVAHAFLGTAVRVCIVESGGMAGERESQDLYGCASIGPIRLDAYNSRMRVFGGTCQLWGGGCIPLDRSDLLRRDWVPDSGWPISHQELEHYYNEVRAFCRMDSHRIVDGAFSTEPPLDPMPLDEDKLIKQRFVSIPVRFGDTYRAELERAPNVTVLLHANLLELQARADGKSIDHARIGTLEGRRGLVRAQHFVLACGGIENARLLLLSNSVVPRGLGNQNDLVGRYFMDHPCGNLGKLFTDSPNLVLQPSDPLHGEGNAPSFTEIALSPRAQRAQGTLNARARPFAVEAPLPGGIHALRGLRAALRKPVVKDGHELVRQLQQAMLHRGMPDSTAAASTENIAALLLRAGLGIGDIARGWLRKRAAQPTVPTSHIELLGYFEQAPNPRSRVTLGDDVDALGQRKARVDWQFTALDRHSFRAAAALFGEELARVCNGRFEPNAWLADDTRPAQVNGTAHHMGTTRMADDPREGVVDRNCRVHGIDNLHVAGSSVFPTGGWAFPTFTIVGLSQRLAEMLHVAL
jgi:choline dehydrogenase-like flavoprotein